MEIWCRWAENWFHEGLGIHTCFVEAGLLPMQRSYMAANETGEKWKMAPQPTGTLALFSTPGLLLQQSCSPNVPCSWEQKRPGKKGQSMNKREQPSLPSLLLQQGFFGGGPHTMDFPSTRDSSGLLIPDFPNTWGRCCWEAFKCLDSLILYCSNIYVWTLCKATTPVIAGFITNGYFIVSGSDFFFIFVAVLFIYKVASSYCGLFVLGKHLTFF